MRRALVVGSGAGGATAANELQGKFQVTVLEAGGAFKPFSANLSLLEKLRITGLFFDERQISMLFPSMRIKKADDMVLVYGLGLGGTTTLATANALRMDKKLKDIGIDLDEEFSELDREIPISMDHVKRWRTSTKRLYAICQQMGFKPNPTPKMIYFDRCRQCGRCVLGCPTGAKWDSRQLIRAARGKGAAIVTNTFVEKVVLENGTARGVKTKNGLFYPADLVILAAGGLGTPVILQNSGIPCEPKLFVDPVLCVATSGGISNRDMEIPMPFIVEKEHIIISPYFDYLSFFFNKKWRSEKERILSLMIKLADTNTGETKNNKVRKSLTEADKEQLNQGVDICTKVLRRFGAEKASIFLGTVNAGHPGGMMPLTKQDAETLHPEKLPENVYVADASLFPSSLGNPPILTIMALAKRIAKICKKEK